MSRITPGPTQHRFVYGQLRPNITRWVIPGWIWVRQIVQGSPFVSIAIDTIYYIPIFVPQTQSYTNLRMVFFNSGTGGGGNTIDFRIFSYDNGLPGKQLASLGTITSPGNANGSVTLAITLTLAQGFYFLALRDDGNVTGTDFPQIISWSFPVDAPVMGFSTSTPADNNNHTNNIIMTVNSVYTDPAPAPTASGSLVPIVWLQEN